MKWNHVISQVDNWIWVAVAVAVLVTAKIYDIPALNAIAGACLVKIKGEDGMEYEPEEKVLSTDP